MSEVADIAIRDLVNKISNDIIDIKSWDIAALLKAYQLTGNEQYLDLAEDAWPTYLTYFQIPRSGSIDYLGYDLYGAFMTSTLMIEYGRTDMHVTTASELFDTQLQHCVSNREIAVEEGALGHENYAFYGLLEKEFNLGVYDIYECFNNFYKLIDFSVIEDVDGYTQSLSYATIAFSELSEFDSISHKVYFNNIIANQLTDYSEVLVETIHAYSLL